MKTRRILSCLALSAMLAVPMQAAAQTNLTSDTWFQFSWNDVGFIVESFTATTSSLLVTDGYVVGDMFQVYANGTSVGITSPVAFDDGTDTDASTGADAWADSRLSKGMFTVSPGDLITIEVTQRAEGFIGGSGFIQSQSVTVPEPAGLILLFSGLAGVAFVRTRRRDEEMES